MKKLIICSDGTWDEPTGAVSNVVKLARSLRPAAADGRPQVVFYDWGLGTTNIIDKIKGGVTGAGIDKNIRDAYRFLVHNYAPGDEIHLFGFSRGAYTVRSVAGLAFDENYLAEITAPDPCGTLHPSRRGIYRIHRAYRRPVGSLGPELEKIHP